MYEVLTNFSYGENESIYKLLREAVVNVKIIKSKGVIRIEHKKHNNVYFEIKKIKKIQNSNKTQILISEVFSIHYYSFTYTYFIDNNKFFSERPNFNLDVSILKNWLTKLKEETGDVYTEHSNIHRISEYFYSILDDAILLENINSPNAGMLYRKALEFLVYDYAIYLNNDKDEEIININSAIKVVEGYLNTLGDTSVNFIKNCFRLGNEYSHYREIQDNENLEVLRESILQIAKYISDDMTNSSQSKKTFDVANDLREKGGKSKNTNNKSK